MHLNELVKTHLHKQLADYTEYVMKALCKGIPTHSSFDVLFSNEIERNAYLVCYENGTRKFEKSTLIKIQHVSYGDGRDEFQAYSYLAYLADETMKRGPNKTANLLSGIPTIEYYEEKVDDPLDVEVDCELSDWGSRTSADFKKLKMCNTKLDNPEDYAMIILDHRSENGKKIVEYEELKDFLDTNGNVKEKNYVFDNFPHIDNLVKDLVSAHVESTNKIPDVIPNVDVYVSGDGSKMINQFETIVRKYDHGLLRLRFVRSNFPSFTLHPETPMGFLDFDLKKPFPYKLDGEEYYEHGLTLNKDQRISFLDWP